MVALVSAVASVLLLSPALAAPVASTGGMSLPTLTQGYLCNVPLVSRVLCPRQSTTSASIVTLLGVGNGVSDGGAYRYTVRYATASRWQPSTIATTWTLPNNATDPAALPLACPQNTDASAYSEDCLSLVIYVPKSVKAGSNVPTMVWFHGGSFVVGSATQSGLDGASFATNTNTIVVSVQYRLGALGFLSPNGQSNLGVKDAVVALNFLRKVLPSLGGSTSKVTIAGQSSGGNMVRALLAAPSASSLFAQAIMQSDPMDYGFYTPSIQQSLNNYFISASNCGSGDTSCFNALSLDKIVSAQTDTYNAGAGGSITAAATGGSPFRPVKDGSFITTGFSSASAFTQNKPVLITNVNSEATATIYGQNPDALPEYAWPYAVSANYDAHRANLIIPDENYAVPANADASTIDARTQLEKLGTDAIWRCPAWTFARNWAGAGGRAYVGMFQLGASYPGNSAVAQCTKAGVVCHQDDIEIVFGTVPSPSDAQSALVAEAQARWGAFLRGGAPNAAGYGNWAQATTGDVHALNLGASGETPVGACTVDYWGAAVQYDYQYYNL